MRMDVMDAYGFLGSYMIEETMGWAKKNIYEQGTYLEDYEKMKRKGMIK